MEKFLDFLTEHNRLIIELIFGFVFVFILYLIYRQFFVQHSLSEQNSQGSTQVNINTAEIEEKLQKILEGQLTFKGEIQSIEHKKNQGSLPAVANSVASNNPNQDAEIEKLKKENADLKNTLQQKETKIAELTKATESTANQNLVATSPQAVTAESPGKVTELETKVKELEGRLQEYEIISEDIADLSFYKEENARLTKELELLKAGGALPAAVEQEAASANSVTSSPAVETPIAAEVSPVAAEEPQAEAPIESPAPAVAETVTEAPSSDAGSGVVDDDIMKEFAAAIEDQKKNVPSVEIDPEKLKESQQLMGDFENFIKKG